MPSCGHADDILYHHSAPPSFAGGTGLLNLVLDEVTRTAATVTVRERHGGRCGGAPETAPRRFPMETDLEIGAAQWDNNDKMEMNPFRSERKHQ
jgi:hypothetical protein